MKNLLFTILFLASVTANAASLSITGNLVNDDDVAFYNFTTNSANNVTFRTWSYAGGTNANGEQISAGGFDPVLALFDSFGDLIEVNDDGIGVSTDPVSGNPWDSLFTTNLNAGDYIVAIRQYGDREFGSTLFSSLGGSSGQTDFDGRTNFWAIDVEGLNTAPVSAVPVPAAVWMFGSGLVGLIGMRKKSSKISTLSA